MRLVGLAVVGCLVAAGCASGAGADPTGGATTSAPATASTAEPSTAESSSTEPSPTEPSPTVTTSPRGRPVPLPDLTAVEFRAAREYLEADGVEVRAEVVRDCRLSKGLVVSQEPAAGTGVRRGDTVTLRFGRTPRTATCPPRPAPPLARALLAWAKDRGEVPPFAPQVRLLQGYRQVASFGAARARDRSAWRLPGGYAEMSAIDLLDWMDDQVLLQPSRGLSPHCLVRARPVPEDLVDRLWWSSALITSSADACLQMGAVQVWVDDAGRISAVGFLSGAP